jgi:hypothetical protein
MAGNGLALGEVADERELFAIGEDKVFRENKIAGELTRRQSCLACVSGWLEN